MGHPTSLWAYPVEKFSALFEQAVENGSEFVEVENTRRAKSHRFKLYGFRRALERRARDTQDAKLMDKVEKYERIRISIEPIPDTGRARLILEHVDKDDLAQAIDARGIKSGLSGRLSQEELAKMLGLEVSPDGKLIDPSAPQAAAVHTTDGSTK
jgi:hypothetical protein